MRAILFTLLILVSTAAAAAQAAWSAVTSGTPTARAALVAGSDGSGLVIFGGNLTTGRTNEIWRFDGTTWTDLTPTSGSMPIARHMGAGTVDVARQKFVVFGGTNDNSTWLGDTWEFDLVAGTWTQLAPATSPSARRWNAMAYDAVRGECVMYGGVDQSGTFLDDTWVWDGTSWTQKFPAADPGRLARHKLTYDTLATRTVLFGGRPTASTTSGKTWTWDGTTWTETVTATIPGAGIGLFEHGMAYDEIRDRVVVYGGVITSGTRGETFEFDGADWVQRGNLPSNSRSGPAMAYVPALGKTYCYGGFESARLADTWCYQTDAIATYAVGTSGQGCADMSGTTPSISATRPWIGDVFEIVVHDLFAGATTRAAMINFVTPIAPIDLGMIGFPQCILLAGPYDWLMLDASDRTAIDVPNNTALVAEPIYLQAVGVEVNAIVDVAVSDRGDAVIGVR